MSNVSSSDNPYETPRHTGPSSNPYETPRSASPYAKEFELAADDDQRRLTAAFVIDRRLLYRVVQFNVELDIERRDWFRRTIFLASLVAMSVLTFLIVFRQPYSWALTMVLVFVVLHALQIIVPYLWARSIIRRYELSGKW